MKHKIDFYSKDIKHMVGDRIEKNYQFGYNFNLLVWEKLNEIYSQINPHIGNKDNGLYSVNETGHIADNYLSHAYLVAVGEVLSILFEHQDKQITESFGKMEKYLKYVIPEYENLIECPFCNELNPPDKIYCVHCNKEIIKEELDGKNKR